jgi:hypothetical protein
MPMQTGRRKMKVWQLSDVCQCTYGHVESKNFSVAPRAQNAKLRPLTKAEISALLNDGLAGFTGEREWLKAKSILSARY